MDDRLRALLDAIYADGTAHDAAEVDRLRKRRNLEPDSAALLAQTVRIAGAQAIVEIGTSNAYSTIWLADAARDTGGRVVTVDVEEWPGAAGNLADAGLASIVDRVVADGGEHLAALPDASVDLLFLDAERVEYTGWWPHPARVLKPGGVLAVDNVLSHPDEVQDFLALVEDPAVTVPVGKGLYLAWRRTG